MEEELLHALKACKQMGDDLAEAVGFLIATLVAKDTLSAEQADHGREAILHWHACAPQFSELVALFEDD